MFPFRRESGFALPVAVFFTVVLAMLVAASVSLSSKSAQITAADADGARAFQAAKVGVQYGINRSASTGACWSGTLQLDSLQGLSGFSATVACSSTTADEGGATLTFFTITSTGCRSLTSCPVSSGSEGRDYSERVVRSVVVRCTAGIC